MSYLSPGVYIEEVPSGPQPIAAAPTSVVAVVGVTARGPYMRPTRVPGWADFERIFGGSVGRYTAEAVYGFFENGGPAAYVVRVDPSIVAQWTVNDRNGAAVFVAQATSPGAWANELDVIVSPDTSGGSGRTYLATVKGNLQLKASTAKDVPVSSTQGIAVGDKVIFIGTAATGLATVNDVRTGTINVTKTAAGGDLDLKDGDWIASRVDAADTTVRLAVANGFKPGDLLIVELPDRQRVVAAIASIAPAGSGMILTLTGGPGSMVPGAQFTDRTARFRGQIGTVGKTVALGAITWNEPAGLQPVAADILTNNYRAFASNGLQGRWNGTQFDFGDAVPPPGTIEVEAAVRVHVYEETVDLPSPTLDLLANRFSFVPVGTKLTLSDGGANSATLTRTAGGFTTPDTITHTFKSARFVLPDNASRGVVVRCVTTPRVGDHVAFGADLLRITNVESPGGSIYILGFDVNTNISGAAGAKFPLRAFAETGLMPLRFRLAVIKGPETLEDYRNLALDPNHPQYFFKDGVINQVSDRITVAERAATTAIAEATMPASVVRTQSGADRDAGSTDYKKGFVALEAETEPAMVICPDALSLPDQLLQADVIGTMIGHCETFRRYAIIDTPDIEDDQNLVTWRNTTVDSTYAGVFAPHLRIVNLIPDAVDRFRVIPPSGFIAGVFARTDRERGVHKAPGNERVRGVVGLAQTYTQRRQDLLNPVAVNLVRTFAGRGIRLWGARNATDDVTWRYVNVRRLFNAVETSIERGTQWVVFEPNTASTWLRVRVSVENFLDQLWRAGALAGTTAAQAYRVRVGLGETMTETDIDLGLIIIEVAIAPAKPAEFVVFRFSHKRLSE